ncbi:hypothetical protein CPB83DRAFT_859477 [Crepidotus variabilis]|uniref:Uncharacterized protein n=1 Tax=Crepidotus variabilis TaxID=179855 RepID=A0A9P6EAG3_9AGAR|nr:hypothetical protein CPB83DRAFT_859477 [Crepidotus variabilis]
MGNVNKRLSQTQQPKAFVGPKKPEKPMNSNLSVWLLPGQNSPENKAFQTILDDLAAKHGKSTYLPHVTLAIVNFSPYTTDAERDELRQKVEAVLQEMKEELFASRITFDHIFYNHVALIVEGRKDEKLLELQKLFHAKINKPLSVPWFPHFTLGYNEGGKEEKEADIKELEDKALYRNSKLKSATEDPLTNGEGMELGGHNGYKIGAIYGAWCGDLKPENWKIFLKLEE